MRRAAGEGGSVLAFAALLALAGLLAPSCGEDVTLGCDAPPAPCAGKMCGASCAIDPCAARCEAPCPKPGTCDAQGACVASAPMCQMPDPCHDKACGQGCDPPGMHPPSGTFACDETGACVMSPVMCGPPGPCAGLACGAPCNPCMMMDGGCPPPHPMACDRTGMCVMAPATCP